MGILRVAGGGVEADVSPFRASPSARFSLLVRRWGNGPPASEAFNRNDGVFYPVCRSRELSGALYGPASYDCYAAPSRRAWDKDG